MSLTITGYAGMASSAGDQYGIPVARSQTESQQLAVGGTSEQSAPFEDGTTLIRVAADEDCAIKIGVDPEADTASTPMYAKSVEYFDVRGGQRLAVIERPL